MREYEESVGVLGAFFWGFRIFDFEGGGGVGVVDLVVDVGYGVFLEVECCR